jgi:hypothetical protein
MPEELMPEDFTPEELEFGRNVAESSRANFMFWMVEQLEPLRERFGWGDEHIETVAHLLMESRDNAIDDVLAAIGDLRRMKGRDW